MVSHPELGSDPSIGSDQESGCDIMSPSSLLVLGIEDGSYFLILKKSIYNCQKKIGLIPKTIGGCH